MPVILYIIFFGFLMSIISLDGGLLLFLKPALVDAIILPLVAFAAGSLISGAIFHMIPHAVEKMGNVTELYVWLTAGFVLFLGLEQFLNWHHSHTHSHSCGPFSSPHQHMPCPSPRANTIPQEASETHVGGLDCHVVELVERNNLDRDDPAIGTMVASSSTATCSQSADLDIERAAAEKRAENDVNQKDVTNNVCDGVKDLFAVPEDTPNTGQQQQQHQRPESLGTLILIADTVHNFLGGLFVGACFVDSTSLGLSAWLAAAFHEIPQELGDFALLVHSGWSKSNALLFNFLSSLTFLLGGIIAYASSTTSDVSFLIPFAAGNFLYIGASDLIPEIKHYHGAKRNAMLYASFLVGIGMLLSIRIIVDGW